MSLHCTLSGKRTIIDFVTKAQLSQALADTLPVTDELVHRLYGDLFSPVHVLPPGELEKRLASVKRIVDAFMKHEASRDSTAAAVGGGVICDMVSFSASLYMRGMNLVLVPTTLLAMVDASVGGKTGIDYRNFKNLLGTFYPAGRVLICPELLTSLSEGEFKNGLAELIKHGFLAGDPLYSRIAGGRRQILKRDDALMRDLIEASLRVKIDIVERDPEEQLGIRQLLNFGHTFAHALETSSSLKLSHGEAVAWGMGKAFEAGVRAGITRKEYAKQSISLLKSFGYPMDLKVEDIQQFMKALKHDKKRRKNVIPFILQKDIADTVLYPLDLGIVESILQ